jgi:hypothetical protein
MNLEVKFVKFEEGFEMKSCRYGYQKLLTLPFIIEFFFCGINY